MPCACVQRPKAQKVTWEGATLVCFKGNCVVGFAVYYWVSKMETILLVAAAYLLIATDQLPTTNSFLRVGSGRDTGRAVGKR